MEKTPSLEEELMNVLRLGSLDEKKRQDIVKSVVQLSSELEREGIIFRNPYWIGLPPVTIDKVSFQTIVQKEQLASMINQLVKSPMVQNINVSPIAKKSQVMVETEIG